MRTAALLGLFIAIAAGCGNGGLSGGERERADRALGSIREFCRAGQARLVHGDLSPEEDRSLHSSRRGVEALIAIYRAKPEARYDPPGAARETTMRELLDTLSRQLRFCDIEATDAIVRAMQEEDG